ncbi:MAG: hypothetical protein WAQ27_03615 [Candidatus Microsaccharimonas sp.]
MKKIIKVRIINSIAIGFIILVVGLGLFSIVNSDGENRYWEGKAFGGSIAIIGIFILVVGIIAVEAYKKDKSISKVGTAFKEAFFAVLDHDSLRYSRRKKKK